ncbi:MAG: hypothetical protein QNJ32_20030 [Xenococcaceae cyanobacterium MO_167.B27]|nr:hypothetical protein [Xenococcaceae cyanobacterium MO_167.B27]
MIVGTTTAAKILNISSARLRAILAQGRVEGAYKTGKMWLIPLFNGKPVISKRKRGPAPRWRNPRKPSKTVIHVNTHVIKDNEQHSKKEPVITVKKRCICKGTTVRSASSEQDSLASSPRKGISNIYAHEVEIPGGCRVIYRPDNPIYGCAKVWIETLYEVKIVS